MKRIVLVGGGTGGHFYPLIAVAEHLRAHTEISSQMDLYYLGPNPYNKTDLDTHGIKYVWCPAGKRRKYFSPLNVIDFFKNIIGIFVAVWKLYVIYPDLVFSKGGYTSVPVVLAAWFLRIPIVIHESDSRPGSANKLAAKFARYIAISFDEVAEFFPAPKTALTGIPIRTELTVPVTNPAETLGLPTDKPIIFVTGGSLGAERINFLILQTLDELLPHFTIIHQTGPAEQEKVKTMAVSLIKDEALLANYFIKGSLTAAEMNCAQLAAELIISRAGAGSIFEIAYKKKPSLLIPIPEDISHDQRSNAYAYARTGAAVVLEEGNLTDGLLTTEILNILNNREKYETMSRAATEFTTGDAAEKILALMVEIADEHI
ncbi:UDP-N-acetylglucosamine--N-acetylmuramyl-(pentapeptide) pyrophosphoryl-undecaprenol N-acetylglucosamine transferase [Candidatus Kaiserbacteria bacterium]|nr:UDP-N-acetylglucosamine--N-acetylmuramyl-(pentapeptide) pyrophosphoryl-undecaprenol N-acetylglucosamine transferase [Candidatus Kaiserbacteria bacterium]